MKIVVNTPSGNVGRAVCAHLLDAGVNVIGLARHPGKLTDLARRGARIRQGALEDEAFVVEATRGADALFWVTPTDYRSADLRAFQTRVGTVAATAVRTNRIPRVVNLSGVGAQLRAAPGPVSGLHDIEMLLDAVAPNLTHLRPAYFFENYLWQLDAIRHTAQVLLPVSGSIRLPMVATRDVARAAADRLLDATSVGRSVWELHGPVDLSFSAAAGALAQGLARPIAHVRVDEGPAREALLAAGLSENVAESMLELYRAIESGIWRPVEARTPQTTTGTTLAQFGRDTLAPRLLRPVAS